MSTLATADLFQDRNGDMAMTVAVRNRYLQDKSLFDRRSVTPEVAGSSPVAPVRRTETIPDICRDFRAR
jgi:hypothetical protein